MTTPRSDREGAGPPAHAGCFFFLGPGRSSPSIAILAGFGTALVLTGENLFLAQRHRSRAPVAGRTDRDLAGGSRIDGRSAFRSTGTYHTNSNMFMLLLLSPFMKASLARQTKLP